MKISGHFKTSGHFKVKIACLTLLLALGLSAQQKPVPRLTYFSGALKDVTGKPLGGVVGVTFALYEEQQGGVALWTETQNVPVDEQGRYTVLLGSSRGEGLPLDLFSSGKARWLGIEPQTPAGVEQPRVLLVGVPYALKAADADTLGGLPASAFLQAATSSASTSNTPDAAAANAGATAADSPNVACTKISSDGTALANQVTKFTGACKIEPSAITEVGGKVGIGTNTPAANLEVDGTTSLKGATTVAAMGAATSTAPAISYPIDLDASSFNSTMGAAVLQHFRLQAEGAGNNSPAPFGTINLLTAAGTGTPSETGLFITSSGLINFASGQTFPGTVTSINPGTGLTSSGGTSPTLSLNTGFTDGRYVGLSGGAMTGALTVPENGFSAGTQLVLSGGNVGIGTNSPSAQLEVAGSLKISSGGFLIFPDGTQQNTAASSSASVTVNPQQVALLKWFPAYQSPAILNTSGSYGLAFDGNNLWVSAPALNKVIKVHAGDGAILGSFTVGHSPYGLAFDGINIWVANNTDGTVSRVQASTGTVLASYSVGHGASDVAFDGTNVWITNNTDGTVSKLHAFDGSKIGTYNVGANPTGLAFDGANIWVASTGAKSVVKLQASTGSNLGAFSVGNNPTGVAFDGANIWVSNAADGTVTKLRAVDGANLGTFAVGGSPSRLAFDGSNIWVANNSTNTVTKLRAADATTLGTFGTGAGPIGVAFDGANIWTANNSDGTIGKL